MLPDGRSGRRHAAGHLRVARRDDSVEAARLGAGPGRRTRRRRRLSRGERALGVARPILGWRILWFLNLPTGLLLIFLDVFIPSRPGSCSRSAALAEAHTVLRRFGCVVREGVAPAPAVRADREHRGAPRGATRLPRADDRAQRRRARLGADQLRPPALDAGAPRRQGLQHGRVERPARRFGADRGADRLRRRVALQPLAQQGRAGRLDRALRGGLARPRPSRAVVAASARPVP